jgi:hypothetical protein
MHRRTLLAASVAIAAITLAATAVQAQDRYPSKPITYIVPFGAGGTTDVRSRPARHWAPVSSSKTNPARAAAQEPISRPRPRPMATPSRAAPSARMRST